MALITIKLNFKEFLLYKQGSIRQRYVYKDGFVFGHGMKALKLQLYHNDEEVCSCLGDYKGKLKFKKIFEGFMKEASSNKEIFENICSYALETEGARRFTVVPYNEYLRQIDNNSDNVMGFKNRTRYRKIIVNNEIYMISVDVNMCEQMEFFCEVIPEKEKENWCFVATPLYESGTSEEFVKAVEALDKEIQIDANKTVLEIDKRIINKDCKNNKNKSVRSRKKITSPKDIGNQNKRDPYIVVAAKLIANGYCELSNDDGEFHKAPVFKGYGPYLEVHHIVWLSKRGTDRLDNVVALCPTCHRKMHIVNDADDVNRLKIIAKSHFKEWGRIVENAKMQML